MFKVLVFLAATAISSQALASPQIEALSRCISDSTNGKDRKDLARWLFVAMAAHPEMRSLSNVGPTSADDASRAAGGLFTRLLTDSCQKETKAAVQTGGPLAIQSAFQTLGQLAMQELMTDKDVMGTMAVLDKYLDKQKLSALGQ